MSRSIDLSRDAEKFLAKLDAKQRRQILTRIADLRDSPTPGDSKQLVNFVPITRRVDSGEYRVAYRFDEEFIYVLLVGKRNDDEIYRKLRRKKN